MIELPPIRSLALDSPRWVDLTHAYGSASDIPDLLRQLDATQASDNEEGPWHDLWSALAHQGDVYPASFAAVPHVLGMLASAPTTAGVDYLLFPAVVESSRQASGTEVPDDLRADYFGALATVPILVARAAVRDWDAYFLSSALAAIAAAKGFGKVAEAALELTPEGTDEFLEWVQSR